MKDLKKQYRKETGMDKIMSDIDPYAFTAAYVIWLEHKLNLPTTYPDLTKEPYPNKIVITDKMKHDMNCFLASGETLDDLLNPKEEKK